MNAAGACHAAAFLAALLLAPAVAQAAEGVAELIGRGAYREAIAMLDASGEHARSARDWIALGDALLAVGERRRALESYVEARNDDGPDRLAAGVAMARLLRLEGREPEADALLAEVLAEWRQGPRDAVVGAVAAGDAAAMLGETDPSLVTTALDFYERGIRLDPANPAPKLALAGLLLDKYNNAEALPLFREILDLDADNPEALLGLARSQYFDHSREAVDTVRRALTVRSNMTAARVLLARLLIDEGDDDGAVAEIESALAVDATDSAALTLRAALLLLAADVDAFEAAVGEIVARSPGYRAIYADLAEIAAEHRLYAWAVEIARRGVEAHPQFWRARALLGLNQLRLGEIDSGRSSLEAAFKGDPFNVWVKNTLDLLHQTRDFVTLRQGRFVFSARDRDAAVLAPKLFPLAEQAYDFYAERYGHRPQTPVRIELYDNRDDFSVRTVGLVGLDILGVSFGPVVSMVSPADVETPINWASVLRHELAHTFHLSMSASRVPRWFTEGLAVAEEHLAQPGWGADVDPGFLAAFEGGKLPPASRLDEAFVRPTYPGQVVHAYFLASLLIDFIERDHGADALVAMLQGYRAGRDSASLFAEILGFSERDLDTAFEDYVRRRFGYAFEALEPAGEGPDGEGGAYRALLKAGRDAFDAGEMEAAEAALVEARRLVPDFVGADSPYHILARIYAGRGEIEAAINQLSAIVATDADQAGPYNELATLYLRTSRPVAAAAALENALLVTPFDADTRERLAAVYEDLGRFDAAAVERRAVLELEPTDRAGARYRLARALQGAGDYEGARREVLQALAMAPLYDDALELLLDARRELGYDDGLRAGQNEETRQ